MFSQRSAKTACQYLWPRRWRYAIIAMIKRIVFRRLSSKDTSIRHGYRGYHSRISVSLMYTMDTIHGDRYHETMDTMDTSHGDHYPSWIPWIQIMDTTGDGRNFASNCLNKNRDQIFTGFWHNLYIRRSPGPSPRFLIGFYPYSPGDFKDSEGKTYQKPMRKNNEKIKIPITIHLYVVF